VDFLISSISILGYALCIPAGFVLLEVLAALRDRPLWPATEGDFSLVVLIPAHQEEVGIGSVVAERVAEARADQVSRSHRVIVIADNCSDQTAAIALQEGAEVLERCSTTEMGKPAALEWALEKLREHAPDVVVFLDADAHILQGSAHCLAARALQCTAPVQARYRFQGRGLRALAARIRNETRLHGLSNLGGDAQITGSGFAVPWKLLQATPVPRGELVEDALWGWNFVRTGHGPRFDSETIVISDLPSESPAQRVQVRRWEHGIMAATLRNLPILAWGVLSSPSWRRLLHLFDTAVPPLALGTLASLACCIAGAGLQVMGSTEQLIWAPALCSLGAWVFSALIGWRKFAPELVHWSTWLLAPWYVFKKVGVYVSFLTSRQSAWVRTPRVGEEDPSPPE